MKEDTYFVKMFGDNLKRVRELRGITQSGLAEKINMSVTSISEYERGNKTPSLYVAKLISEALDVSIDELCQDSDLMTCRGIESDQAGALLHIIRLLRLKIVLVDDNVIKLKVSENDYPDYVQNEVLGLFRGYKKIQDLNDDGVSYDTNNLIIKLHDRFKNVPGLPDYSVFQAYDINTKET